jgi:hypothetical protein
MSRINTISSRYQRFVVIGDDEDGFRAPEIEFADTLAAAKKEADEIVFGNNGKPATIYRLYAEVTALPAKAKLELAR